MKRSLVQMSREEKVGQLILGQVEGWRLKAEFETFLKKYKLGGYRVKQSNLKPNASRKERRRKLRKFLTAVKGKYQENNLLPPLLAADQEGGSLGVFNELVTNFPGNMALGACGQYELACKQGIVIGNQMQDLGINLVFAPVADVNLKAENPVIGVRSFGDDPRKVAKLSSELAAGLNEGGVLNSAKHFPGHGNTETDSHKALPINDSSLREIRRKEVYPFSYLIDKQVDTVMVAHVLYPKLSEQLATLSSEIISGMLRGELNYQGVISSDDLEMRAIANKYDIGEAVKRFIKAGGDLALVNGSLSSQAKAYEALLGAVKKGEIEETRINKSVKRIIKLKEKMKSYQQNKKIIANPEKVAREIINRAVTLFWDPADLLPLERDTKILAVIPANTAQTEADTTSQIENNLGTYLAEYYNKVEKVKININADLRVDERVKEKLRNSDVVIQGLINCLRFPEQIKLLKRLSREKPVISISLRTPYDIRLIPDNITALACYGQDNFTMKELVGFINGSYQFKGTAPVKI